MPHLTKGWDAFQPDPGTVEEMECRVCKAKMDVRRNVEGPTSWVSAMAGSKRLHDSFTCPHYQEKWHEQAQKLLEMAEATPSARLEAMFRAEVQEILDKHEPTKDTYSVY